jgi:hypothetical protein
MNKSTPNMLESGGDITFFLQSEAKIAFEAAI